MPDFATEPTLAHLLPGELATLLKEIAFAVVKRAEREMRAMSEKRTGKRFMRVKVPHMRASSSG